MGESEVARLRRQIEVELEAVQRGMYGLAVGAARHEFIRKRMDRVGVYHDKLAQKVGEDVANLMVYTIYNEAIK
jgi:hypothetical protein